MPMHQSVVTPPWNIDGLFMWLDAFHGCFISAQGTTLLQEKSYRYDWSYRYYF
jgi:hypothetical protein